jgi:hypothetical protein
MVDLAASVFVIAFCVYKLVLVDRMGFCYRQLRFVSSEELILNHLDVLMKSGQMKLDAADTTPKAYLSHHPNCCKVDWGEEGVHSRGLRWFGSASVSIIYEMSDAERKRHGVSAEDTVNTHYEFIANDTACGETVGYVGITTKAPAVGKPTSN